MAAFGHQMIYNPMSRKTECMNPACDAARQHKPAWAPYVGEHGAAAQVRNEKMANGMLNPHDLSAAMRPVSIGVRPNYGFGLRGDTDRYTPVNREHLEATLAPAGTAFEKMTEVQKLVAIEMYDELSEGHSDKEEVQASDAAGQNDRCHAILQLRNSHEDEVSNSIRFARTLQMNAADTVAYLETQPEYQDLINPAKGEVDLAWASRAKLLSFCKLFQAVSFPSGVSVAVVRSEATSYINAILADPTYTPRLKMSNMSNLMLSTTFLNEQDYTKLWANFSSKPWAKKIDFPQPGPYDWVSAMDALSTRMPAVSIGTATIMYVTRIASQQQQPGVHDDDDTNADDASTVPSSDDDDASALTRATKLVNSMRCVPKFHAAFSKATNGRAYACVGMQSLASMRGSVKYDGGAEEDGAYWVHVVVEYNVVARKVTSWLGSICQCVVGNKWPGCAHGLAIMLLLAAMPLTLADGTPWEPGRGTVTSNVLKVWNPTDQEPELDVRRPMRFHQQCKSKVDHDPEAAGTRIKPRDVRPGWLHDPVAQRQRFEHLTTTLHDDHRCHGSARSRVRVHVCVCVCVWVCVPHVAVAAVVVVVVVVVLAVAVAVVVAAVVRGCSCSRGHCTLATP